MQTIKITLAKRHAGLASDGVDHAQVEEKMRRARQQAGGPTTPPAPANRAGGGEVNGNR